MKIVFQVKIYRTCITISDQVTRNNISIIFTRQHQRNKGIIKSNKQFKNRQ
jgi:hypothetical protein